MTIPSVNVLFTPEQIEFIDRKAKIMFKGKIRYKRGPYIKAIVTQIMKQEDESCGEK